MLASFCDDVWTHQVSGETGGLMKFSFGTTFSCLLVWCVPWVAQAETITFDFAGVLTTAEGRTALFNAGPVAAGDRFSGRFTYDRAAAFVPDFADFFIFFDAPSHFTVELGRLKNTWAGVGFRPDSAAVFGRNDTDQVDRFSVLFLGNPFLFAAPSSGTVLNAFNPGASLFRLTLSCCDEDPYAELNGRLTELTLIPDAAPIPEPTTLLLAATGAGMLCLRRRRSAQ